MSLITTISYFNHFKHPLQCIQLERYKILVNRDIQTTLSATDEVFDDVKSTSTHSKDYNLYLINLSIYNHTHN